MKYKLLTILTILLIMPFTLAQELEPEIDAGITPDSGLYGLDVLFDNIRVAFTTNAADKARLRLEIAQERVAEMVQMANENKLQDLEKARTQERIQVKEVENLIGKIENDEKVDIQQRLQKHILVLETVLEKVPEQAKEAIQKAIDSSSKVFDINQEKVPTNLRETETEIRTKIDAGTVRIVSVAKERR